MQVNALIQHPGGRVQRKNPARITLGARESCPHCCIWNENMRLLKGYAPRRTEMGDEPIASGKFAHRKVLDGRQEGNCKGCSHRPKWSKGHGEISPIES